MFRILVLSLALSSTALADNLLQIYEKARDNDATFQAAKHTLTATEEKLPQAASGLLPTIGVTGKRENQRGEASFSNADFKGRDVRNWDWKLTLSQPIFKYANIVTYRQAHHQIRQAHDQFRLAEQDLILRVATAYFELLLAKESVSVSKANVKALENQLKFATVNLQVKAGTIADKLEAQSKFDLARSRQVAALNEQEVKQAELEKILGEPVLRISPLRGNATLPKPFPQKVENWMNNAKEHNQQVLVQVSAERVANSEVTKNSSAHLPTLDLNAGYGNTYASGAVGSPADISTRTNAGNLGLSLTFPIYGGGLTQSKVREAKALHNKSLSELEAAKRLAATTARQAYSGVMNGHAQIAALSSAVKSGSASLEANKIGYKIGTKLNTDVLNAEDLLYTSRRDLFKAKTDTIIQGLKLKASTGTLEEADILALNKLLNSR